MYLCLLSHKSLYNSQLLHQLFNVSFTQLKKAVLVNFILCIRHKTT